MGFPVFIRGGGPFYVMEPTFGYHIGMIIAADLITGAVVVVGERRFFQS